LILLYAVLVGLIAGSIRAWSQRRPLTVPTLQQLWLVPIAFLPQWFAFFWSPTARLLSAQGAAVVLVGSQLLLIWFVWVNRHHRAVWWLGLGLLLNLLVIVANGGLMPISPETVARLVPERLPEMTIGQRAGTSKDVLLPEEAMIFPWLADRFITPNWLPQRAAFSLGDVLIAVGAFWLLWQLGKPTNGQPS